MSPLVLWAAIAGVFMVILGIGWVVNKVEARGREAETSVSASQRSRRYATTERVRQESYFGQWWT